MKKKSSDMKLEAAVVCERRHEVVQRFYRGFTEVLQR